MPALTTIHMARKPLEGTVAANALKYGTGSLNIRDTRLGGGSTERTQHEQSNGPRMEGGGTWQGGATGSTQGRWPANVILQHAEGCQLVGSHHESFDINTYADSAKGNYSFYKGESSPRPDVEAEATGQVVEEWSCVEGCPVTDIDEQSGVTVAKRGGRGVGYTDSNVYGGAGVPGFDTVRGFDDKGGASRYFKQVQGRWPANVILQHLPSCKEAGTRTVNSGTGTDTMTPTTHEGPAKFGYSPNRHQFNYGTEQVANWTCAPGCPVTDIDAQAGRTKGSGRKQSTGDFGKNGIYGKAGGAETQNYADQGGPSRFFKQSQHDLLDYLCAMISTPDPLPLSVVKVLDSELMSRTTCGGGQLTGAVWQGAITAEEVEHLFFWLPPGGHVLIIAPDSQPTGHTGAILLEDAGFEIRDAILLVRGPGRAHYVAKAGRNEREAGCGKLKGKAGHEAVERKEGSAGVDNPRAGAGRTAKHVKNFHPTVKPIAVMERLLADVPVESTVLDPFMGSGTTGIACSKTGHSFIGIERDPEYLEIADTRVRHWDRTHVGWQGAEIESDHKVKVAEPEAVDLMDFFG
jgi:hypothetical protein